MPTSESGLNNAAANMTNIDSGRRSFCLALGVAGLLALAPPAARAAETGAAAGPIPYPPIIGAMKTYVTKYTDTFADLGRKYGLGYTELVAANPGIDPWVPGKATKLVLPSWHILPDAPHEGIVINLADQRLYYFRGKGIVQTAPLGIGDDGWNTPTGATKVVRKKANPTWHIPKSIRAVHPELPASIPPGPENPLGDRAMYLAWNGYLIHGTNKPDGVGRRVSHGCIRMYPEDIHRFFNEVKIGTPVRVVNQTVKVARYAGRVWLEVAPNQAQTLEIEQTGHMTPAKPPEFEATVILGAGDLRDRIDWPTAYRVASERRGYPVAITPGPKKDENAPLVAEERTPAPHAGTTQP